MSDTVTSHEDIQELASQARRAARDRNWLEALRCWETVRARQPNYVPAYLGAVTALQEFGRHEEAERILNDASGRFADNEQIAIASGWLANARRDWPAALTRWEAVRERSPDNPLGYLGGANALREIGRPDEAEAMLDAAATRFPDHEQLAMAHAWSANARRDWPAAVRRWESVRTRFPDNPRSHLGGVRALQNTDHSDQADALLASAAAALAAARQRGSLDATAAERLEFEIARARLDWSAVRQSAERIIAMDAAPGAQVLLGLAQACWHLGDKEAADHAAQRAIAVDPTLTDAILVRAWVATDRGDGEATLSCYRRLVELNPGVVRWPLKVVQLLNWLGHVEAAVRELDVLSRQWPDDPMVRTFLRNYGPASALPLTVVDESNQPATVDPDRADEAELQALAEKAPGHAEQIRPPVIVDPDRDVLTAEVAGADTAVLVFTGSNDAVSMPLALFDRYLATLEISAVYLKDFNRLRFLRGVRSLGEDYMGTLATLRRLLDGLGVRRLRTIGNCDGGFAAIRYGVELGADRIITFSAPTHTPQEPLTRIAQTRNFMRNRLAAMVPPEMANLRPFLESHRHSARIEFFYEVEDPYDRAHAAHLASLPGIRLHPRPGFSNHHLLRRLALTNDDFCGVLGRLLAVGSAATRR